LNKFIVERKNGRQRCTLYESPCSVALQLLCTIMLLLFTVLEQVSDSWTTFRFRQPGAALPDCRQTGSRCALVPKDTSDNSASRAHLVLDTSLPAVVLSRRASRATVTVMPPSATRIQVTAILFVYLCTIIVAYNIIYVVTSYRSYVITTQSCKV